MAAAAATGGAGDAAAADWDAVRRSSDIQFAPLQPPPPQPPAQVPDWLQALGRAIEALFAPIGRLLGLSWPVFQWVLVGLGVLLALYVLWRLLEPLVDRWRRRQPEPAAEAWAPSRSEALALLADADRLAAEGCFAEATHLLLRRSVRQIGEARPDWLIPASTAREIAVLPMLPEAGRRAFATIADRVERSLFALRALDGADWRVARAAYAEFASIELRG